MSIVNSFKLLMVCLLLAGCSTARVPGPPPVDVPEPGQSSRSTTPMRPVPPPTPRGGDARVMAVPDEQSPLVSESLDASPRTSAPMSTEAPAQSSNPAVNTLLARADSEWKAGNSDAAVAAAERALRIAPSDPAVYLQLAELRLARGEAAMAEQLARKGLSYQPEPRMRQRLLNVLEQAMEKRKA